ncbi:predicted protein [Naegleria gruberi]|uniref:Predicted protein n=1 Tax=Naegleria gruberi TaxID=5762 RepID=D2VFX9_NAEGR|nr:uncharacterized protein NAEGRDRAFT_67783 [Naegleria gruberi]EFC44158.1 predicted protein [Naegleria gruberi]|eukprot:XP_002676902.1 predicted protein [Naegleria gruberi strain NEG-M]
MNLNQHEILETSIKEEVFQNTSSNNLVSNNESWQEQDLSIAPNFQLGDTNDILSNTQLDNISNMADDLESLEIPELGDMSNASPMFTKVQQEDDINEEPLENHNESQPNIRKRYSLISQWNKKKVSLCCGGKIGIVPCLSVMAILLSILALISIALLVALPFYEIKKIPILDLMTSRAKLFASYIAMRDMLRLGVENKGNYDSYSTYYYYYYYKNNFNNSYTNFTHIIPTKFSHEFLTKPLATYPIFVNYWDKMVKKVVSFRVINGTTYYSLNKTIQAEARSQLYSVDYATTFNDFQTSFYDLQDKLFEMCHHADMLVKNSGIATLFLVCFSLAVILPTILIIFIFALRKDRSNAKNLHSANRNMLKETMSNPSMRRDFRKFCKDCKMEGQYLILEKIQFYKEFSLESYDAQMNLFELTGEYVRKQNINMKEKNSRLVYKVAKEAEKKLVYFERMKYETIFEIVENFHEVNQCSHFSALFQEVRTVLDLYNNKNDIFEDTDLLPSKLFDNLEKELSTALARTHLQFKSTSGLNASKAMSCNSPSSPIIVEKTKPLLDQSVISTTEDLSIQV